MSRHLQLYLPKLDRVTLLFLQQVLMNEKTVLSKSQVSHLDVPSWPELAIREVWGAAQRVPGFREFIPDDWSPERKTERKFFYAILTHLTPGYVQALVRRARILRTNRTGRQQARTNIIQLHPNWQRLLASIPFRSSKQLLANYQHLIYLFLPSKIQIQQICYGGSETCVPAASASIKSSPRISPTG